MVLTVIDLHYIGMFTVNTGMFTVNSVPNGVASTLIDRGSLECRTAFVKFSICCYAPFASFEGIGTSEQHLNAFPTIVKTY